MDARKDVDQAASLKCRECALRGVCLPASLLDPDLRQLEEIIRHNRRVARHKYLTRSSDPANQVYALRSGTLKTYLTGNDGRELVTGFVFPGELVGLDAFAGGQSASHVMALEPSLVCAIPVGELEDLLTANAKLRTRLFKFISHELQVEQDHLRHSREGAGQRFMAFFLDLSARHARRGLSPTRFSLPMTRAEIGSYLGLTTETVSRLFTRSRQAGLIETRGREVQLLDVSSLAVAHAAPASRISCMAG
jgi:CRP/FNR family transcriptional regulator